MSNACAADSFAVIVQGFMAVAALASLFYKRHRESPQRPLLIWTLDTSKQAIAASMIHFLNILVSYVSQSSSDAPGSSSNPCVFYFLNILLDTTVGVGLLYIFLKLLHRIAVFYRVTEIESGVYGDPVSINAWAKQLGIFISSWVCVKVVVVIGLSFMPWLVYFAKLLLYPLEFAGSTKLQSRVPLSEEDLVDFSEPPSRDENDGFGGGATTNDIDTEGQQLLFDSVAGTSGNPTSGAIDYRQHLESVSAGQSLDHGGADSGGLMSRGRTPQPGFNGTGIRARAKSPESLGDDSLLLLSGLPKSAGKVVGQSSAIARRGSYTENI
ncbi:MAG: hypothetical protein SGCHY_005616 [Lobulomycetales sp.]